MVTTNRNTTGQRGRPEPSWVLERLEILARRRGATVDGKGIALMVSSISGFTESAIEAACRQLESEEIDQFAAKWPATQSLVGLCRFHAARRLDATEWTMQRYRDGWYWDRWIEEQVEDGQSREEAVARLSKGDRMLWVAWRNQTNAGTIHVPRGWCPVCQGDGLVPIYENGRVRAMKACACRKAAA